MNNWNYLYMLISLPEDEFEDYLSDTDTIIENNNNDYDNDYDYDNDFIEL